MAVTLHTTHGDIKLELEPELAPRCSENFLALCACGYYNGVKFHRNIRGLMIQGGDPTGTGKGGESVWGGAFPDEFNSGLQHDIRGRVSMVGRGADDNRSQFFITYAPAPHLNNKYSVFGRVIHGLDVLDVLERVPVLKKYRPTEEIVVERTTIHANPFAEKQLD